jgi:HAD superfamily hydrolase (TIGR01509 family)
MTAIARMTGRTTPLQLVIFDCDGVLVDSEGLANRVVADELTQLGWPMTPQEANDQFLGRSLADMLPIIQRNLGRAVPTDWPKRLTDRLVQAMAQEVEAIPGAVDALQGVTRLGLPWRVASNSSHAEMRVKFSRIGVAHLMTGRVHSFDDVRQGKPAPDLFLAAAAAAGVPPAACVVVEDSVPGSTAARAAGMDCLGYAAHDDGAALWAVGASPFHSMFDLPDLIALAPRAA